MKLPIGSSFVRPDGTPDAKYVFVGEQPSYQEKREGVVFVGPAGKELDKELMAADIPRMDSYLTNVIKDGDKKPYEFIQLYKGTRLLSEPIITARGKEHLEFLKWELQQTQAKVFTALGAVSLFALTGMTGITKWRGSLLDCTLVPGRKVIPTFHPASVIPPKNNYLNRRLIIFDIRKARDFIEDLYIPTYREVTIAPTFHEAITFLLYLKDKGLKGNKISYDIEVHMERKEMHVSCISFATNLQAMSIPFTRGAKDYFTTKQEMQIMKLIADLLEDDSIGKVAHNAVFDGHFLLRRYGIKVCNVDDTMIAQQILMPDYNKGLDFVTSLWTDHPYYKAEGKNFIFFGTQQERGWNYNATDSNICDEALPKQLEQIHTMKNWDTYERQRKMIEPCVYMMERGIKADVTEMNRLYEETEYKIAEAHQHLCRLTGRPDLPTTFAKSGKQLKEYFFHEKGIKPYKKRRGNKWVDTYDDLALKRLTRRGFEEAKICGDIRKMVKLKSTYLDIGKIDEDGRSRCSYNTVGTRYSRLSSSKNIFGSGGNHQNWPHHLQKFLKPDNGYVYYAIDLSQAENRIVAFVGAITEMMQAFINGDDVHALTAALIFNKHPDDITREDGTCPIGDGSHSERFWGKKANHGFNYGWSFKEFALENEIRENEGKMIFNGYHGKYPGVQKNFHQGIIDQLNKNRTLTNLMGRKTTFYGDIHGKTRHKTFQEAFSCIPQGTVGDIINELGMEYVYYSDEFKAVELLRQVHDEIGFQIPLRIPWIKHAKILLAIKQSLEKTLITDIGTEFIIPADISMGNNLNKEDCTELKNENFSNDPAKFATILERTWADINEQT